MTLAQEMKKFTDTGNDNASDIIYNQVITGILDAARNGFIDFIVEFDTDAEAQAVKTRLETEGFNVGAVDTEEHTIEVSWDV